MKARLLMAVVTITALVSAPFSYAADDDIGIFQMLRVSSVSFDETTAAVDAAKPESCATCHGGAGEGHQAVYDKYTDESAFEMIFTDFTVGPGGAANTFDGTLEFTILKDGLPFTDFAGLDDARFLVSEYNSAENDYQTGAFFWITMDIASVAMGADGDYTIDVNGLPFDPTVNGQVYGYIAQTPLFEHEGSAGSELPEGTHVHLYDDVANAALAFGDALVTSPNAYVSAANVGGCEKCHGMPYLKHGYRAAEVDGVLPDFAACKSCHLNERGGFAEDFQYMADEPFNWASDVAPTVDYGYRGNIMNNVHMSHAMEFPYPQSMQNCATCHGALTDATGAVIPGTDKLAMVLDDTQFTAETCLSCHPVQGIDAWPKTFDAQGNEILNRGRSVPGKYYQANRAPALDYLWFVAGVDGFEFHNRVREPVRRPSYGLRRQHHGPERRTLCRCLHGRYRCNRLRRRDGPDNGRVQRKRSGDRARAVHFLLRLGYEALHRRCTREGRERCLPGLQAGLPDGVRAREFRRGPQPDIHRGRRERTRRMEGNGGSVA